MATLEELTPGAVVRGVIPGESVTVVASRWAGSRSVVLTFRTDAGRVDEQVVYRTQEAELTLDGRGTAWSFDGDGASSGLSPRPAESAWPTFSTRPRGPLSLIEPLPHQIDAVYGEMLPRQPLRFLLADDPGAGKTIMAGLFIKELMIRGDVERCLVVAPGEPGRAVAGRAVEKFGLDFEILTRDMIEAARTGNPFAERTAADRPAGPPVAQRGPPSQAAKLTEWDLVDCRRGPPDVGALLRRRGQGDQALQARRAARRGRTALPADDGHAARRQGRGLPALHGPARRATASRVKCPRRRPHRRHVGPHAPAGEGEAARRSTASRCFPSGAPTPCPTSCPTTRRSSISEVTEYVKRGDEPGRAAKRRRRRSPRHRRRLRAHRPAAPAGVVARRRSSSRSLATPQAPGGPRGERAVQRTAPGQRRLSRAVRARRVRRSTRTSTIDDLPDSELEELEEQLVDQASARARSPSWTPRSPSLTDLVDAGRHGPGFGDGPEVGRAVARLLADSTPEMFDAGRQQRRKLIIFTEHRDTLNYLVDGSADAARASPRRSWPSTAACGREERRKVTRSFTQDKDVQVLVATDAAGEGINLQRAHLMVNYDLPWNPNRIEQRFGRIHRIGQTEVCHLWNLVADDTREGQVFERLLEKLREAAQALGDQVFDVLGDVLPGAGAARPADRGDPLRQPARGEAQLDQIIDAKVGVGLAEMVREHALSSEVLSTADLERIRADMLEAEARKLQPGYVQAWFAEAFARSADRMTDREKAVSRSPSSRRRYATGIE